MLLIFFVEIKIGLFSFKTSPQSHPEKVVGDTAYHIQEKRHWWPNPGHVMWDNGAERKPILNVDVALNSLGLRIKTSKSTIAMTLCLTNTHNKYRALTTQLIGSTWCLFHTQFGAFFFMGSDLLESNHSNKDAHHHKANALVRCQHFIKRLLYKYKHAHI